MIIDLLGDGTTYINDEKFNPILFQRKVDPNNPNYILGLIEFVREHTRHSSYCGRMHQKRLNLIGCDPALNLYYSLEGKVLTKPATHGPWASDRIRNVRVGFDKIAEHLRKTEGFAHYADLVGTKALFELPPPF